MSTTPLISIIDDDEAVRIATAALVRALGYEARAYASAEAFLDSPSAAVSACLIVDVQMPGMSGPELQRRLLSETKPPPMIFITAFPDPEVRERVLAMGAINVLGKPCDGKVLVHSIETALSRG